MGKTEVLVDTEFLHKLSAEGKNIEGFKKVLDELEFQPVIHPYIATKEIDMYSYFQQLVDEGYVRVATYDEFLRDEADKKLYSEYFQNLHDTLRKYLEKKNGAKQIEKLVLNPEQSIFEYRKAGMSLGDVHMVLMASFTQIPVILSDDGDMEILKPAAKKKFVYSGYKLTILGCVEVLETIARMEKSNLNKKELLDILKRSGEAKNKTRIYRAWKEGHEK